MLRTPAEGSQSPAVADEAIAPVSLVMPRVVFGRGAVARLGDVAAGLGGAAALLVCDPALRDYGVVDRAGLLLRQAGLKVQLFDGVSPNPDLATIEASTAAARRAGSDLVVGLGGGSALDVAKATALSAAAAVDFASLLYGDVEPCGILRKVMVPTTAGSGSEVSRAVVVSDERTGRKAGLHIDLLLADVAVVDPDLTLTLPPPVTADTGIDALAHAVEAYLAANASPLSDAVALRAFELVWKQLPVAWRDGSDAEARSAVAAGSVMGGMAFTWAGLGAVHALAYPLTTEQGLSHGRANAVMLPHVLPFNLAVRPEKAAALTRSIGLEPCSDAEVAKPLASAIGEFVRGLGISTRLRDYGVKQEAIAAMAASAVDAGGRLLTTNPRPLAVEQAVRILEAAW